MRLGYTIYTMNINTLKIKVSAHAIYGLWAMVLQFGFSTVNVYFAFIFKRLYDWMLPGEGLPKLTTLVLNIWFQVICCCISLCVASMTCWKGCKKPKDHIKYLLILMTMDMLWCLFTLRNAQLPFRTMDMLWCLFTLRNAQLPFRTITWGITF